MEKRWYSLYLKALEIQGFKSFPDKTVLTFGEDITAIVGPNGSGKSNISDAVRWVMGEQSTRALRGGKMEDVIFGGTARRRQIGFAEVSLVLDNTDRAFDRDESEIMVTRRYFRSGESEYYINRRSARLRDINELFMDTGLGREGYSIISQGKIDEILSVRSSDRREIFEEAAGISRFRHRKEESEQKLRRTDENLLRINDKIAELELQVEPLRRQSETAKKFLRLRDEIRGLEIAVWLETLERLRAGRIKTETDYREAERQLNQTQIELEKCYAQSEQLQERMREKDLEVDRLRQEVRSRETAVGELESAIAVLKSSIQNNEQNTGRIRQELAHKEGREEHLANQIRERRARIDKAAAEIAALKSALEEIEGQARQAEQSVGSLTQELERLRERKELEQATAAQASALLSALTAAAGEVEEREGAVRQELQALNERLEQARADEQAARQALSNAQEERDRARNTISGYQLRLETRRNKAAEAKERHAKLQMEENALTTRIRLLADMEKMHEGYSKAVKLVMGEARRGTLRNIHGPVADLLKTADRYTVAIETALGSAMQNLVVDREEDGKAVIQYLKRRDAGRATILPLSAIQPGTLREADSLRNEPGFVGIGSELIQFETQYQNIFSNLLGRVAVMEDLNCGIAVARKYGYRFRIVTLDGQMLNPGGSMTGGSASRSAGILSRANELERLNAQSAVLTGKLEQAARDMEEKQREAQAAEYQAAAAREELRGWEDAILKAEGEVARCAGRTAELAGQHQTQREELDRLQQRAQSIADDTRQARERIQALEGSANALRAETEGAEQGQQEARLQLARMGQEAARLSGDLAVRETEREADQRSLEELEGLKADLAGDRTSGQALLDEYQAQNNRFFREIGEKEELLQQLRRENQAGTDTIRVRMEEKMELEGQRNRCDRDSRDRNDTLLHLQREVSLLEQKKIASSMEEKQILDKLWDSYQLSHEAARRQRLEIESIPKASRRIAELRKGISALGSVNVGAIEEFERINERYTYLSGQRDDVQRAKGELERIIAGITAEMRTIFAREFKIINEAFGQTFTELFGGGKAALELEDPNDILNCGIEIKVQPPGKALKVITLLSGGEKAFVAIALYFAILKVRPTPFVVMDEIEAALDENNVTRFARYMRTMADKTQFIVITHRRGTMEEADVLYGVTMQEQGVSRILTINLNDVEKELRIK